MNDFLQMNFPFLNYTQTSSSLPYTSSFAPPHPSISLFLSKDSVYMKGFAVQLADFSQSNVLFKNKCVLKPRLCALKTCQVPSFNIAHFLGVIFMLSTNSGCSYIPANSAMKLTLKCIHSVLSFQCFAHRKTFLDVALLDLSEKGLVMGLLIEGKQQNAAFLGFFFFFQS